MLFMNEHALHSCSVTGSNWAPTLPWRHAPVGRKAAASTDLKLNAEILFYSWTKGVFAGVGLHGAAVQADKSGDQALYGDNVDRHNILDGKVPVPDSAERRRIRELGEYSS